MNWPPTSHAISLESGGERGAQGAELAEQVQRVGEKLLDLSTRRSWSLPQRYFVEETFRPSLRVLCRVLKSGSVPEGEVRQPIVDGLSSVGGVANASCSTADLIHSLEQLPVSYRARGDQLADKGTRLQLASLAGHSALLVSQVIAESSFPLGVYVRSDLQQMVEAGSAIVSDPAA